MDEEEQAARWVKRRIRTEMARGGWTYSSLTEAIKSKFGLQGDEWNEKNVANKVGRGTFSATFFLRCLMAMGVETLKLEPFGRSEVFREPGGRAVRLVSLESRDSADGAGYKYEVFGISGNWRIKKEEMEKLIREGEVVQYNNEGPPLLRSYL